jgi:hypothetical protein
MYFAHPLLVSLFVFFILGEEGGCAIALVGRKGGDAKNGDGVMIILCGSIPCLNLCAVVPGGLFLAAQGARHLS